MSKPTDAEYNTALARLAPSTLRRSICGRIRKMPVTDAVVRLAADQWPLARTRMPYETFVQHLPERAHHGWLVRAWKHLDRKIGKRFDFGEPITWAEVIVELEVYRWSDLAVVN